MLRVAALLVLVSLPCGCAKGPCGSLSAQAGTNVTSDPLETCGADHDSVGLLFTDLAELIVHWTVRSSGAVQSATVLNPRPRLVAWTSALQSGASLSFPASLAGDALIYDDTARADRTLPLTHGTLEVTSWPQGTSPTAHLRWNLIYEASGGALITSAGDDDVTFTTTDDAQEPTLRPPSALDAGTPDGGTAPDAGTGTACTREFGVAPSPLPTANQAPAITFFSRESAADELCTQPALAYLGTAQLSGTELSTLTNLGVAFPGFQVGAAQFLPDSSGLVTFVACASHQQSRALIRFESAAHSFDACADLTAEATTGCPFPSSLPAPDSSFVPTFTRGSDTSVTLCPAGLQVAFSFTSSLVTTVGYTVEQPIARVQTVPNATGGTSWAFSSCLVAPDLGAFHLQLISIDGHRGPIECMPIR